jgi:hypothetical protein
MAFWKRLFGTKVQQSSSEPSPRLDEKKVKAAATVISYRHQGWFDIIRDHEGEVAGFWLAQLPESGDIDIFLKSLVVSEKLGEVTFLSISLQDYRVLPNTLQSRGGYYVMIGSERAPGEPIPSLQSNRWRKGEGNPKSERVVALSEASRGVKFLCPSCRLPTYCFDSDINVDTGAMVQCGNCGNISHVPAVCKVRADVPTAEIMACIYVPIAEFGDWFFGHPCYDSANVEDWGSYGLWAYCAQCKHQFKSTVLAIFPAARLAKSLVFNASSPASARDMDGLLEGKCPQCSDSNLLALMIEIPEPLRRKIAHERRRRAQQAD